MTSDFGIPMKRFLALFFSMALLLIVPASASALTAARAHDETVAYARYVCYYEDDGCLDWDAYNCQWLYSDHAKCVGTYDNRSVNGVLWHHTATVYWRQLSNGYVERYNLPTVWTNGRLY